MFQKLSIEKDLLVSQKSVLLQNVNIFENKNEKESITVKKSDGKNIVQSKVVEEGISEGVNSPAKPLTSKSFKQLKAKTDSLTLTPPVIAAKPDKFTKKPINIPDNKLHDQETMIPLKESVAKLKALESIKCVREKEHVSSEKDSSVFNDNKSKLTSKLQMFKKREEKKFDGKEEKTFAGKDADQSASQRHRSFPDKISPEATKALGSKVFGALVSKNSDPSIDTKSSIKPENVVADKIMSSEKPLLKQIKCEQEEKADNKDEEKQGSCELFERAKNQFGGFKLSRGNADVKENVSNENSPMVGSPVNSEKGKGVNKFIKENKNKENENGTKIEKETLSEGNNALKNIKLNIVTLSAARPYKQAPETHSKLFQAASLSSDTKEQPKKDNPLKPCKNSSTTPNDQTNNTAISGAFKFASLKDRSSPDAFDNSNKATPPKNKPLPPGVKCIPPPSFKFKTPSNN